MSKGNKILPYIIFGVPALIAVYLIYKSIKGKKGQDAPATAPNNSSNSSDSQTENTSGGGVKPSVTKYFPLKKGSKGGKVTELQTALISLGKDLGATGADGDFGSKTEAALKSVTSKISVDSQQELDNIKAMKGKVDNQKIIDDANRNRIALANRLLDALSLNKNLDFYALHDVQVIESSLTTDGREYNPKNFVYHEGQKIETRGYTKEYVSPQGFIKLYNSGKVYSFSPYGFQLK